MAQVLDAVFGQNCDQRCDKMMLGGLYNNVRNDRCWAPDAAAADRQCERFASLCDPPGRATHCESLLAIVQHPLIEGLLADRETS